jgi:hypothetical protein
MEQHADLTGATPEQPRSNRLGGGVAWAGGTEGKWERGQYSSANLPAWGCPASEGKKILRQVVDLLRTELGGLAVFVLRVAGGSTSRIVAAEPSCR